MKEYITGANGFIGKHLCQRLDLEAIPHDRIPITRIDPFNRFFFLSAYGNMADQKDTQMTIQANVTDPLDIATRSLEYPYQSFVFYSTSSVNLPTQTLYSRTKKATEQVLLSLVETLQKPICIIRPYSVTGVGEQANHLIPTAIRSCLDGVPMNLVPEPTHDFIDVDDVVEATINLSDNGARGIFEVGSGKKYTNRQVLDMVEEACGCRANVTEVPSLRKYDTDDWVCKNFRARSWGWLPKKPLQVSIKEMVDEYRRKKAN